MNDQKPSRRIQVHRGAEYACYDRATIDAILDEAWFCTVGFVGDDGDPVVIPTIHVRVDDRLVLHGSPASRLLRTIPGRTVSVAVTLLDGVVLARSVFHHSLHYRSVVLFGTPSRIEDPDAKLEAMRCFAEKLVPGRWGEARIPDELEIRSTTMVEIPIQEASAKVLSGPPTDDSRDLDRPAWAGVIPFELTRGTPIPAPNLRAGIDPPPGFGS